MLHWLLFDFRVPGIACGHLPGDRVAAKCSLTIWSGSSSSSLATEQGFPIIAGTYSVPGAKFQGLAWLAASTRGALYRVDRFIFIRDLFAFSPCNFGRSTDPIYSSKCRLPMPAHRHRLLTEAMSGTGHARYWLANRRLASGLRRAWHRESQRWRTAPHKHWRSGSTVVCSLCTENI